MVFGNPSFLQFFFQVNVRAATIGIEIGKSVDQSGRKVQDFTDFSNGTASTISNDIGCHRGTVFSIAVINLLDHAFASVATGQVQIDIRPAGMSFTEKAFKEQFTFNGIHRGNPQAVTDRTIRRTATTLDHHSAFSTEIDDVPNDQKVTGESKFFDDAQFMVQLFANLRRNTAIAIARTEEGYLAQKRIHAFSHRYFVAGKFIAEILQRKIELVRQAAGVQESFRIIPKKGSKVFSGFEVTLGILTQELSCIVQMSMIPQTGEYIADRSMPWDGISHCIGSQDG